MSENRPFQFSEPWEAHDVIGALFGVLARKVEERDRDAVDSTVVLLVEAYSGADALLRTWLNAGGARVSAKLSGVIPHGDWRDIGSDKILDQLAGFVALEQLSVDAMRTKMLDARTATRKSLRQQIEKTIRGIRQSVRFAKGFILRNWPEDWTEKLENEYREYL